MAKTLSIKTFSRGMNDWLHPSLLETNTAASLVNADESSGKIVPIKRPIRMTVSDPV